MSEPSIWSFLTREARPTSPYSFRIRASEGTYQIGVVDYEYAKIFHHWLVLVRKNRINFCIFVIVDADLVDFICLNSKRRRRGQTVLLLERRFREFVLKRAD